MNKSPEEIMNLPIRRVKIAGISQSGRWDRESGYVYLTDENGNLTGRYAKISTPSDANTQKAAPPPKGPVPGGQITAAPPQSKKLSVVKKKLPVAKERKKTKPNISKVIKSKKFLFLVCCVLLAAVALFLSISAFSSGRHSIPPDVSAPPGENTLLPVETPSPISQMTVIQVTRDIMPGEVLNAEDIQPVEVSSETYNQISLGGTNLYQWNRKDGLLGMYASTFLPAGQYLSYASIATIYEVANNPWGESSGSLSVVDVPLDGALPGSYALGDVVTLSIQRRTTTEIPNEDAETTQFSSGGTQTSSVSQSIRIDEFTIPNVTIANIISADGGDLYRFYAALADIPAGEQLHYLTEKMSTPAFVERVTPQKLRFLLSAEVASALGGLEDENLTVTVTKTDGADIDTTEKADMHAKSMALNILLTSLVTTEEVD